MSFEFKKINFIKKLFRIKTKKEKEVINYKEKIDPYFIRFLSVDDLNNHVTLKSLHMYMEMNLPKNADNITKENAFMKFRKLHRI